MSENEHLLTIDVAGEPEPQGSATAFVPTGKNGQPFRRPGGSIVVNVTSDNPKLKKWRERIAGAAREACGEGWVPVEGEALEVEAHFFLKRPDGQWGTGRNAALVKDSAPAAPIVIPDVDKLVRAVLDGLSGVVYKDDNLVTRASGEKHYAVPSEESDGRGAYVIVRRCAAQSALDLPPAERSRFVVPEASEVDAAQLALA